MNEKKIATLTKLRLVDKYIGFYEIMPEVLHSDKQQKELVTALLDECCRRLVQLFTTVAKPRKPAIKKPIFHCMDELTLAPLDAVNREFAYQLGWFIADKAGVDLRKGSMRKAWGYWAVQAGEVKVVGNPRRKKIMDYTGEAGIIKL